MDQLKNCLLTGIPLIDEVKYTTQGIVDMYWYRIEVNNIQIPVSICSSLYEGLADSESDISKYLKQNRYLLLGELGKDDFKSLKGKVFHWTCDTKDKPNHYKLQAFIEYIISQGEYPKNRKEKFDNLLRYLHQSQPFEGGEIRIRKTVDYYGKLYFQSFEELQFFLREIQRKELIEYNEQKEIAQFTFFGLEYFDTITKSEKLNIGSFTKPQYEIGLSFASENREYVEKVAQKLTDLGITVFYDAYEQVNLWGKDLYQHLNDVYKNKCQYCIIFISEHYAKKLWTKHELKSAQARAFSENKEYILPARFDATEVPGLNSTVFYLDCLKETPEDIALFAAAKVKQIKT